MENKTILITGSNSGFGRLIAETLAQAGYTTFASMRETTGKNKIAAEEIKQLAEREKLPLHAVELDVTSDASVERAVSRIIAQTGRIDSLVNNAGIGGAGLTEAFTIEQIKKCFEVNVFGVYRANRAVLPQMRKQGDGLLIHISSSLGRVVVPFSNAYCSTKFALEALAESYHYELAPLGIESVIVEPGAFPTEFAAKIQFPADEKRIRDYGEYAETPGKMFAGLAEQLNRPDAPDPQAVADAIKHLIELPRGSRPLRTPVGADSRQFAGAVNEATSAVQNEFLKDFGI